MRQPLLIITSGSCDETGICRDTMMNPTADIVISISEQTILPPAPKGICWIDLCLPRYCSRLCVSPCVNGRCGSEWFIPTSGIFTRKQVDICYITARNINNKTNTLPLKCVFLARRHVCWGGCGSTRGPSPLWALGGLRRTTRNQMGKTHTAFAQSF
jgi:hypothetical protein